MKHKAATLDELHEWEKELSFLQKKVILFRQGTRERLELEAQEMELAERIKTAKKFQVEL